MEHVIAALNVVLPVFAVIAVGYFLRYKKVVDESFIKTAMKVVFNVSLPGMLFLKVSNSDVKTILTYDSLGFVVFVLVSTFAIFFLARIIAKLFVKNEKSRGAFVQGSFRSNYVIIGYSVLYSLFGDEIIGRMAILVITIVPLYNILSIWVLSETTEKSMIESLKEVSLKVIKNPLIIGIVLGFLVSLTRVNIPVFVESSIGLLGDIGTPLGLLGIGAYFSFDQIHDIRSSLLAVALKVFVFPAFVMIAAYLVGFGYMDVAIIFVLFASPAAISSFIMATALEGDSQLAANIVVFSTMISLFTLVSGLSLIALLFSV